ncbi:MAG: hypothetical protein M3Q71_00135 [Chloroflexota bacterium]|nr:hypothetical protein [Chloroflexota bacterium]
MPRLPGIIQSEIDILRCRVTVPTSSEEVAQGPSAPHHPDEDHPDEVPSLEVVFEEMKHRLQAQTVLFDRLGDDARFVLTAASLLVAGFGALPGFATRPSSYLDRWLAVPSLCIYFWLVWTSMQGFRLSAITVTPEPSRLRSYLIEQSETTKRRLIAAMDVAFERNKQRIADKTCQVQRSQQALVAEAAWLTAVVILRGVF